MVRFLLGIMGNSVSMRCNKLFGSVASAMGIAVFVFVCSGFNSYGRWTKAPGSEAFGEKVRQDTLVLDPSFVKKYNRLSEDNIDAFIRDWERWSMEYRTFSTDSMVNQAIGRVMRDYSNYDEPDCHVFYSMPDTIKVVRCQGVFDVQQTCDYSSSIEESYVPSFDSDKAILYMTPEIKALLSSYLGGVSESRDDNTWDRSKWTKINKERFDALGKLFYVAYGHWGGYWELCCMPKIFRIRLYDDGFVADLRLTWYAGESVFIPNDCTKEEVRFDFWIE